MSFSFTYFFDDFFSAFTNGIAVAGGAGFTTTPSTDSGIGRAAAASAVTSNPVFNCAISRSNAVNMDPISYTNNRESMPDYRTCADIPCNRDLGLRNSRAVNHWTPKDLHSRKARSQAEVAEAQLLSR